MKQQYLIVYLQDTVVAKIPAPEGCQLEMSTASSGALCINRWILNDPLEIQRTIRMYAEGTWTRVEKVYE